MEIRKYAIGLYRITLAEREKLINVLKLQNEPIYAYSYIFDKTHRFSKSANLIFDHRNWCVTGVRYKENILLTPAEFIENFGQQRLETFYRKEL